MSNTNYRYQGVFNDMSNLFMIDSFLDQLSSMPINNKNDIEILVNACLDSYGIDRRYNALILEELRDCTNLTHEQLKQAALELTAQLRSTNYVAATNVPPSNRYPNV